jgi:biotin transport system substrate-specific component
VFAILGGALLIALATRVQVPMWPVPMTLQTLAVLLVAMTCGARLAVGAVLAYLAQGAMGLPVFAAGGGLAPLVGPTAGYLWGFVLVAWVVGSLADRGLARGFAGAFGLALLGSALVYVVGASWLAGLIGAQAAWTAGVLPFLAGDLVKSALAALLVPMGWRLLARRP